MNGNGSAAVPNFGRGFMQDRVFRLGPFIKLDILSKNPISVNHEEVVFGFSLQRLLIKENFFLLPPPKLL